MRLFIALPLEENTKKILAQIQEELKKGLVGGAVKWVEPKNFHQTIIFLGQVGRDRVGQLKDILSQVNQEPINLSLSKLGFFPDQSRPRVIWVGLKGEREKLSSCFHRLRLALSRADFQFDTRFSPHITLGRVRFGKGQLRFASKTLEKIDKLLKETNTSFQAKRLVLFQSKLTPAGPIYQPLFEIALD